MSLRSSNIETERDIVAGHFAHVKDPAARELLEEYALQRGKRFGSRFIAGNELTAQPPRILSELGYDPTSDRAMARSRRITEAEVTKAMREHRFKVTDQPSSNKAIA